MGMTYNVKVVNKEGVKLFVDNIASKFTKEELEKNKQFLHYPGYEPYTLKLTFEWDRYDFIYRLLESKRVADIDDEYLQKASVLFDDCCIEVFDNVGVRHAIEKLEKLLKFDDDHGPGPELDEEIKKIYGENRTYKYDRYSCKELLDDFKKMLEQMEKPAEDIKPGHTNDVYWMIYAY